MQQTIPVNDRIIASYVGTTPSTGPFTVDFPFFSLDDVVVTLLYDGATDPVILVRGADYSLVGVATEDGSFSSGTITLVLPVANVTLTRSGDTTIERLSNFPLQGFFSRLALNAELNKLTVIDQEFNGRLDSEIANVVGLTTNAVQVPRGEEALNTIAAAAVTRANRVLAWDGSGNIIHSNRSLAEIEQPHFSSFVASMTVAALADLKGLTDRPDTVLTKGYFTALDGGGGPLWTWIAGSTATANDFMVVQPTSGPAGRYIRLWSGQAVSPKWAGCGLGAADDTTQFQKVINFGAAIDASGGTYPVAALSVLPGNTCPGIFSDGSGTFIPTPTSNSNTIQFTVTKTVGGFYFRCLRAICPISSNPVVAPVCSRPFYFVAASGYGEDWEVSDCHVEGYVNGISVGGGARNLKITRNYIKGTWADGISGPNAMDGVFIDHNTLTDGGFATGGPQPAGAIRVGLSSNTLASSFLSICHNHIARYCNNSFQSAIDCFSGNLTGAKVDDNFIEDCGGSIECKTGDTVGGYRNISISNNKIKILSQLPGGGGVSVFYTSAIVTNIGKAGKFTIEGNKIYCDPRPLSRQNILAILYNGFDNADIKNNTIIDVNQGIRIDSANTGRVPDTSYDVFISGNTVDATEIAITHGAGTTSRMFIHNNPMLRCTDGAAAVGFSTGTVTDLSIKGNYIVGGYGFGLELRDVRRAVVSNNTISGNQTAIQFQGTPADDVVIENNRLRGYVDPNAIPATNVLVTNPGAGLTNGVRTFTVTNGTGTLPTIFQFQVTAGSITGSVFAFLQAGSYSVFPTVPTVTVDTGIVGGATFTMTPAVTTCALAISGSPTNIRCINNSIDLPLSVQTINGTAVLAGNVRGVTAVTPQGVSAGSKSDIFLNSNVVAAGTVGWICTTNGSIASAVWKTYGTIAA